MEGEGSTGSAIDIAAMLPKAGGMGPGSPEMMAKG